LHGLTRIGCVYLSPGGSSERIYLFYATVSLGDQVGPGGGVLAEGEDIRLISMTATQAIAKARAGEIQDAKTLIAIQWLELMGLQMPQAQQSQTP
jgi:ADP-ribose pyrophosphatase